MYEKIFKRLIDIVISIVFILISSPIIILITIILFFSNKGNVFFIQSRPGKDQKIFSIYKFKTMNDLTDSNGKLLPDEKRITRIGKIIRDLSFDELLQFFNVLKGDMSLIGPRPLLIEYLPLYNERQMKRHLVKPGITGLAQIKGRNVLSWEERLELDVIYVENLSFTLDLKIFFKTIIKVLKREGISPENNVTMDKFKGTSVK